MSQPDCKNDLGVILTVGIVCNADRCAIVLPLGAPGSSIGIYDICTDAMLSFQTSVMSKLLACMAASSYVSFLSAEPMIDGGLPGRVDYDSTAHVGSVTGEALPSNTGGLMVFYRDPAGTFTSARTPVGKNTVPGVPTSQVVGDKPNNTYVGHLQDLADAMQDGWDSAGSPGDRWYRYLRAPFPRTPNTNLAGIANSQARGYLATQRRRFIPR